MNKGIWAIAAALAWGVLSAPASAAPAVGAGGVKAALAEQSNVERVDWVRRCYRDRFGDRHCRRMWVGPRGYGPGIYFDGGRRHYGRGHHFRGGGHMRGHGHMGGHGGRR